MRRFALLICILAFGSPASAQDYPTKTIRIVGPFGPWRRRFIVGRISDKALQDKLRGRPVVTRNRRARGTIAQ